MITYGHIDTKSMYVIRFPGTCYVYYTFTITSSEYRIAAIIYSGHCIEIGD